jgi:hypothetical protein
MCLQRHSSNSKPTCKGIPQLAAQNEVHAAQSWSRPSGRLMPAAIASQHGEHDSVLPSFGKGPCSDLMPSNLRATGSGACHPTC